MHPKQEHWIKRTEITRGAVAHLSLTGGFQKSNTPHEILILAVAKGMPFLGRRDVIGAVEFHSIMLDIVSKAARKYCVKFEVCVFCVVGESVMFVPRPGGAVSLHSTRSLARLEGISRKTLISTA